jgi:hypothetical protein
MEWSAVQEVLDVLLKKFLFRFGCGGAAGAHPHGVHKAHPVELQLVAAATAAEDLAAATAVVLHKRKRAKLGELKKIKNGTYINSERKFCCICNCEMNCD